MAEGQVTQQAEEQCGGYASSGQRSTVKLVMETAAEMQTSQCAGRM